MGRKSRHGDEFLMKIDVRGLDYKVFLWEDNKYFSRFRGSYAHTTSNPYEIHFCKQYSTLAIIKHELFHCFLASCFVDSWENEDSKNLEEVACDVFGLFDEKIRDLALSIENSIKRRENGTIKTTRKK